MQCFHRRTASFHLTTSQQCSRSSQPSFNSPPVSNCGSAWARLRVYSCPLIRQLHPCAYCIFELQRLSSQLSSQTLIVASPAPSPPCGEHRCRLLRMLLLSMLDAPAPPAQPHTGSPLNNWCICSSTHAAVPHSCPDVPSRPPPTSRSWPRLQGSFSGDGTVHAPLSNCRHHSLHAPESPSLQPSRHCILARGH